MSELPRRPPEPVPAIHPVPEYRAASDLAAWYEDMKASFQVPWMGVVTMAFAHYPTFYETLWTGLKPLAVSRPFVEECRALRGLVEAEVDALDPPPIRRRLADMGYAGREVAQIRAVNEVFSHGNFLYMLLASVVRWLLEGSDMAGEGEAPPYEGRHAPDVDIPLVLMEAHHADRPTRDVYEDVKAVLRLPFVNTDYRAFARWPSYFAAAWGDLREVAGSPRHEAICQAVHDRLVEAAARRLPNPGGLTAGRLRAAAAADAPLEEVADVVRLFQWLLPGLVTNVAYLRAQLAA